MKNLSLVLSLAATVCSASVAAKSESISSMDNRPNVLVILLDDAGYNDFGFMGSSLMQTPNIDRLASAGTMFTDAHTSATVSGPSRSGILTGRYQQRFGAECNFGGDSGLPLSEATIAHVFKESGYATSCIGKWHQGKGVYHPNKRGFDHFYGFIAGSRSYFYRPHGADAPGNDQNLQLNGVQQTFDGYMTDVLAAGANDFINGCENKPFMMYLAFNAVHTPMEATQEDLNRFSTHPRKALAAMTWAVDRAVGSVIDNLRKSNKLDNTIIFFLSDNGGDFSNKASNTPLKGHKGNKYEGGHRVPFFVVWNNNLPMGAKYDQMVSSMDIFPTAAAAAKIKLPKELKLDGVNIVPNLLGLTQKVPHEVLFWRKDKFAAMRYGKYKYVRADFGSQRLERIYDLSENLGETTDIIASNPDLLSTVRVLMDNWERQLIAPMWTEGAAWDGVCARIHEELMNNKPITKYCP